MKSICAACLIVAGGAAAAADPLLDTGDKAISISGEAGKDSEIRTIRIQATEAQAKTIALAPGHIDRKVPDPDVRIDRGQVKIAPVTGAKAINGYATYEISVTGLPERYGTYSGTIEVKAGGKSIGPITMTLTVRLPASVNLVPAPASVSMSLVNGSLWGTEFLSNRRASAEVSVSVVPSPKGTSISVITPHPLMSANGKGSMTGKFTSEKTDKGHILKVEAESASADKYSGSATIYLTETDRTLSVPVEVSVRTNPWHVLLLVALGVVIGQLAKWMNDLGKPLLAAQARVDDFSARVGAINADYRQLLYPTVDELRTLIQTNRLAELDAALARASARAAALERALRLLAWAHEKGDTQVEQDLVVIIRKVPGVTDPATLTLRLNEVEERLNRAPVVASDEAVAFDADPRLTGASGRVRSAKWLNRALQWGGVALISFVGYEAIYLNGSPTFGANFSDYLTAMVWGLGADVAARTISSLGRTAPPK